VRSFRRDHNLEARDSQHGILCGEVIHTLAPQAELLFANWEPECPDQFLDAVRWARDHGAQVFTCSLIMPTWSDGDGHGPVHAALAGAIGNGDHSGDGLFFACAGNTAQRHWGGSFSDGGKGLHQWSRDATGPILDNPIYPWGGERVSVELCWQTGAYELSVQDTTTDHCIGKAQDLTRATQSAIPHAAVAFQPQAGHSYCARVRQLEAGSGAFHLVVLAGGLHYAQAQGSIPFPGDGPEVIAVGAVDTDGRRWEYSACGPKADLLKPDLVATVPFPSSWRSRPFSGTSAAAPQAAALAALLWQRHPDWTARQVRVWLFQTATPSGASSLPWETGHGRVHIP
jgi:subtilisin family serine protease